MDTVFKILNSKGQMIGNICLTEAEAEERLLSYRQGKQGGWKPYVIKPFMVDDTNWQKAHYEHDLDLSKKISPVVPEIVEVVREYIAARDAYEAAIKPSSGFGQPKRLSHGDLIILRYRNARSALNKLVEP